MRNTKYEYIKVIQGYFSTYWEDVSEYRKDERELLKHDLKEYSYKSQYAYRVINRRVLKGGK